MRGQKLSLLSQRNPGIVEGDRWVQEHVNLFHKPVLGPVLTLIECDDRDHQNYLQGSCKDFLFAAGSATSFVFCFFVFFVFFRSARLQAAVVVTALNPTCLLYTVRYWW